MTDSGGYDVQPDCAAPPVRKKLASIDHAADEVHPVAHHVELGERHVGRADLQRHDEVAEAADGQRHDAEEHHDGAVHRAELVVELRQHDAARRLVGAEQAADQRNRRARIGQLLPHQHHQREAEEQEQQAGDRVLDADDLVIDREDVLPPEAELFVRMVIATLCTCPCAADSKVATLSNAGLLENVRGSNSVAYTSAEGSNASIPRVTSRSDCMQKAQAAQVTGFPLEITRLSVSAVT